MGRLCQPPQKILVAIQPSLRPRRQIVGALHAASPGESSSGAAHMDQILIEQHVKLLYLKEYLDH